MSYQLNYLVLEPNFKDFNVEVKEDQVHVLMEVEMVVIIMDLVIDTEIAPTMEEKSLILIIVDHPLMSHLSVNNTEGVKLTLTVRCFNNNYLFYSVLYSFNSQKQLVDKLILM